MNWQKSAIEDLNRYEAQSGSLENIRMRIEALNSAFESTTCSAMDRTPVQGGAKSIDDRLLDNIVERERLEHTYRATKCLVQLVDRGLAGLSERERLVLEKFFIQPQKGHVEKLMEELHFEQRRIYQLKEAALYKFTIVMYGLTDY